MMGMNPKKMGGMDVELGFLINFTVNRIKGCLSLIDLSTWKIPAMMPVCMFRIVASSEEKFIISRDQSNHNNKLAMHLLNLLLTQ